MAKSIHLVLQATCLPRDLLHLEIAGRDDHGRPTATPGACTAAVASPSPWPDPPWASPESKPQSPKVVRCRLSPPPPGNMGSSKIQPLGIQSPSQMMIGVHIHLLNKVFRFHYHSQKVIGSLGRQALNFSDSKNPRNQKHTVRTSRYSRHELRIFSWKLPLFPLDINPNSNLQLLQMWQ